MRNILTLFILIISCLNVYGQGKLDITGKWKTIDDKTGKPKSIVEIVKLSNGIYAGRIIKLFKEPTNPNCIKCTGILKNKPLIGLEIIKDIRQNGNEFGDGKITDPETGKSYNCIIARKGNQLEVRGYVGIVALGRTQRWHLLD